LTTEQPDRRPVVIADGVRRLRMSSFRHGDPPEGVEPLVLDRVQQIERDRGDQPPAPPEL